MSWNMKGVLLGACSCDWGCPCSFNARPTQGFCEGAYVWHVKQGQYDGTDLAGISFCWLGKSPGTVASTPSTLNSATWNPPTPPRAKGSLCRR
jgi:hypothetical protein